MAEYSFEVEHSRARNPRYSRRPHYTSPARSQHPSSSYSFSSSSQISHNLSAGGRWKRIPATPFASDDDKSWQSELSWQFDPAGWRDNRDLSAALSPWTASSAASPSNSNGSRVFRRSANDYFLSRTTVAGFRGFTNPYYDHSVSHYEALPSGRLELQSYVSRDSEDSFTGRSFASREHFVKSHRGRTRQLSTITERRADSTGPLIENDELSLIDYDAPEDIDRQIHLSEASPDIFRPKGPGWLSISHAYMDHDMDDDAYVGAHLSPNTQMFNANNVLTEEKVDDHHMQSHLHDRQLDNNSGSLDHHFNHLGQKNHGMTYGHHIHDTEQSSYLARFHHMNNDEELAYDVEEDSEEDDAVTTQQVSLFGLFKYSTKFDLVLVLLGCLGALINGGSLPWYSYLFGKFVSKIANEAKDDKNQMMRDVGKVYTAFLFTKLWRKILTFITL